MKITVRYSAQARHAVGQAEEALVLDASLSVRELLVRLAERHANLRRLLLTEQGDPQPALLLFIRDEQVGGDSGRRLSDGDVVSILPPIAGG